MKFITRKRVITWLTALYIVLLTTLCLVKISAPTPDLRVVGFDKLVHFCFYLGLNTLLITTVIAYKGMVKTKHIAIATIVSILYGIVIELIQQQVGRDFDLYDIVANSFGAIVSALLLCCPKIKDSLISYLQNRKL